jgi:hypothetical protein
VQRAKSSAFYLYDCLERVCLLTIDFHVLALLSDEAVSVFVVIV